MKNFNIQNDLNILRMYSKMDQIDRHIRQGNRRGGDKILNFGDTEKINQFLSFFQVVEVMTKL